MKRTKILATYGPAISNPSKIRQLVAAGVNAFRINCSHGANEDLIAAARLIREGTSDAAYPVAVLFDISGPKLRLSRFDGELELTEGQILTLTADRTDLARGILAVNHPAIIDSIREGERLFIDDGNVQFEVVKAGSTSAEIRARHDGHLSSAKGINLPDTDLKIPTITDKDRQDIKTAVALEVDYVALSFVRTGDDITEARELIKQAGGDLRVIAKLEKRESIERLDEIMKLSDGVMIARGDLGVELPASELPHLQKKIITLANKHQKPVIVATQMLESMRFSPRATRAEINDVASAVFDFVDVVMLSAETASGKYPLEAVRLMSEVIEATESAAVHSNAGALPYLVKTPVPQAIAHAVSRSSAEVDADVIYAFTTSGYTACLISNLFPTQLVIALTPNEQVMRHLSLYRSVYAVKITQPSSFQEMMAIVDETSKRFHLAEPGRKVIITGGAPFGSTEPTNFMMFHEVV